VSAPFGAHQMHADARGSVQCGTPARVSGP
jgi:hypothetical protein